jgi:hypothetical protein
VSRLLTRATTFLGSSLVVILSLAVGFSVTPFYHQDAHGAGYVLQANNENRACQSMGGIWNSADRICTVRNFVMYPGDALTVSPAATLRKISMGDFVIRPGATLISNGVISLESGTMTLKGGNVNVNGLVSIGMSGTFQGYGKLNILSGGVVESQGSFYSTGMHTMIYHNGKFIVSNPYGLFRLQSGALEVLSGGTLINSNLLYNSAMGIIVNSGTITNDLDATIENSNQIFNLCAVVNDAGTIRGSDVIDICNHRTITKITPSDAKVAVGGSRTLVATVTDIDNVTHSSPRGQISWHDVDMNGTFSVGGKIGNVCTLSGDIGNNASSCRIEYTPPPRTSPDTVIIRAYYSGEPAHRRSFGVEKLAVLRESVTEISTATNTRGEENTEVLATVSDTTNIGAKIAPIGIVTWKADHEGVVFSRGTCALVPISASQSTCSVTYAIASMPETETVVSITASFSGDPSHLKSISKSRL